MFAAGIGPGSAATLELRGHQSGRTISFPVVVADYRGERYLVAMLGRTSKWVRNLGNGDGRAVLVARPSFTIDRHAPIEDFERIVDQYPVFRVARSRAAATSRER
jgi:hypothetical protein